MQELEAQCKITYPYCVVIGCQGKSSFENILFGSNAVRAMKHLHYPIIAVPIDATYSGIENIGFACDFKQKLDNDTVFAIKNFVSNFITHLYVCNIGAEDSFNTELIVGIEVLEFQLKGIKLNNYFITCNNIEKGLANFTRDCKLDILIMFPKYYTFIEKIMHISETKKMVLNSAVPIMALHQ